MEYSMYIHLPRRGGPSGPFGRSGTPHSTVGCFSRIAANSLSDSRFWSPFPRYDDLTLSGKESDSVSRGVIPWLWLGFRLPAPSLRRPEGRIIQDDRGLSISHTCILLDRVSRTETCKSAFGMLNFG